MGALPGNAVVQCKVSVPTAGRGNGEGCVGSRGRDVLGLVPYLKETTCTEAPHKQMERY